MIVVTHQAVGITCPLPLHNAAQKGQEDMAVGIVQKDILASIAPRCEVVHHPWKLDAYRSCHACPKARCYIRPTLGVTGSCSHGSRKPRCDDDVRAISRRSAGPLAAAWSADLPEEHRHRLAQKERAWRSQHMPSLPPAAPIRPLPQGSGGAIWSPVWAVLAVSVCGACHYERQRCRRHPDEKSRLTCRNAPRRRSSATITQAGLAGRSAPPRGSIA
jgi:hypothetical protein